MLRLRQVAAVLGSQWGDEGKGKLVDILAQQYDVVARAQVCSPSQAQWMLMSRSPKRAIAGLSPTVLLK